MADFSTTINRDGAGAPPVPEPVAAEIIQELPKASVLLNRARQVRMSSKTLKQPVLSALPDAYWVNGDTGLKQTTGAEWDNQVITAEELAAIVVIPDALFDDSSVPLWDEVRPLLTEAIGRKVDEAGIFGIDKPASWPTAIVPGAIAAGNTVAAGTGKDLGVDVASLGQLLARDGFAANGFASEPGLNWELVGLRTDNGVPLYQPALAEGTPSNLYGKPLNEVDNGAWDSSVAKLLAADWQKFVVGVRQDITFQIFDSGVISDANGKVIVNLMQQDSKALRVVFRLGFQVANPLTRLNGDKATRYPAAVLAPAAAPAVASK
ncbi:phage major capsid protein [Curtobacterium sp. MCLR17_036]|uniref:phage major capsid protein n=1 Tax=Curtobacterium sp. MCLR17_036 TaxID=2175620 RepID=UPI000DA7F578|nr:phage major capsid protein [Curtobacterium sp. MCLR17_036]WIE65949.1 phage major capsid protein [Curtobacterium sp. MCLR17_036]